MIFPTPHPMEMRFLFYRPYAIAGVPFTAEKTPLFIGAPLINVVVNLTGCINLRNCRLQLWLKLVYMNFHTTICRTAFSGVICRYRLTFAFFIDAQAISRDALADEIILYGFDPTQ